MSQVPLAPPPQTGQPIDSWLYLLWRRLTATGQMLWSSIVPGSSAEVAAVVTDETGSPGSLVFSGNPTLQGLTVEDAAFTSRGITDNATATVLTIGSDGFVYQGDTTAPAGQTVGGMILSVNTSTGINHALRKSVDATAGPALGFLKSRGTNAVPTVITTGDSLGTLVAYGFDGTNYKTAGQMLFGSEGTIATGQVPSFFRISTADAAGTLTEAFRITSAQRIVLAKTIATGGYTVATLPAGAVGDRAYVTDALAPAYGVAVAGAGAVTIPVFYNGAAWICA